MKDIVGLVAPNYAGKTSVLDALLYSIFKETTRTTANNVININRDNMRTYIEFSVNDIDYTIERIRTKDGTKKTSEEKIKIMRNGELISDHNNNKTNEHINEILCTSNAFLECCCMQQSKLGTFLYSSPHERKKYLCEILGIDILNEIFVQIKSDVASLRSGLPKKYQTKNIKKIKKSKTKKIEHNFDEILSEIQNQIDVDEEQHANYQNEIIILKKQLDEDKRQLIELIVNNKNININSITRQEVIKIEQENDDLDSSKNATLNNIQKIENSITLTKNTITKLNNEIKSITKDIDIDKLLKDFTKNKDNKIESLNNEKNDLIKQKYLYTIIMLILMNYLTTKIVWREKLMS